MTQDDAIPERLATALSSAKQAETLASAATTPDEVRAEAVKIAQIAIDIAAVFESRMQRHFKRGPFFKELQKRMNAEGQDALGAQAMQYAHAINVLKHGHGKSHRALLVANGLPFKVRKHDRNDTDIGLVDVLSEEFFDGLVDTLRKAYDFLENPT